MIAIVKQPSIVDYQTNRSKLLINLERLVPLTMSKVDRRILKSQEAIKKAVLELMSEKSFDEITIQDLADRANVNRGTIYLHYVDKFDLLDKLMEEHINQLRELGETACEMEWRPATLAFFEYFERHYFFFSTMLASKGSPFFRTRFLDFLLDAFKQEVDTTNERNASLSVEVIVQYMGTAYVGIVEWWIANGMPYSPKMMAEQVGILLERTV